LSHAVHDEARQMVGGQTVAQPHRQIECLVVVHGFECSFHAHQYTITDGEGLFLSDKLLAKRENQSMRNVQLAWSWFSPSLGIARQLLRIVSRRLKDAYA